MDQKWKCMGLLALFWSASIAADQCTTLFPGGAQSHTAGSQLSFSCGTRVLNNPTNSLIASTVNNPNSCGTPTCGTANCSASGAVVNTLNVGNFQTSNGAGGNVTVNGSGTIGGVNNATTDYDNVTVQPNGTLNFSSGTSNTTYRIQNLTLRNHATVNLQPGDYWIEHANFQGGQVITFMVQGTGTARIYFANDINVGQTVAWNTGGTANQLFLYSYARFTLNGAGSAVKALLYAQDNITLSRTTVTGAVTGREVRLNNNSTIQFDGSAVNNTDFGAPCPKSNTLFSVSAVPITPNCQTPPFGVTQTAGNNFTFYLTAYNANSCAIDTSYNGSKTIRFYTTYVNPSSGTLNAKINETNIANSQAATPTMQSITFTNGVAMLTGNYPDVGQLKLFAADNNIPGIAGASANFVVIPAKFAIQIPGNTATQTLTPVNAAVAACVADAVFKKAGVGFTVNVQPQNAQGNVTPNFGNESTPEGIVLKSSALLAPIGGRNGSANNGVIANASSFTKVTGSAGPFAVAPYFTGTNFSFDEVGCINLTASITSGNYLGVAGNVTSANVVGRFIPDYFDVTGNTPKLTTACNTTAGSFTYLDQPFMFSVMPLLTVTAKSFSGSITQNYTGSFWKLTNSGFGESYQKAYYPVTVGDIIPNLALSATLSPAIFVDGGNGTGSFTFSSGAGLKIERQANVLVAPFIAEIQLLVTTISDPDGVSCTGTGCVAGGFAFGGTTLGNGIPFSGTGVGGGKQFYHGRLVVTNAIGSEWLPLDMPMQTQFYTTNNGYLLNTLDSCTVINGGTSSLVLSFSSGLSSAASLPSTPVFQNGILNIKFSGSGTPGYVDVEPYLAPSGANLPWLQSIWPGITGGAFTGDPFGRATFGIYNGDDPVIYREEIVH